MQPVVKMATTEAEREAIYRLRYEVYIEEMNGQSRHAEADVAGRQLYDEWDPHSYHFYVEQNGRPAACARLTLRRDGPFECDAEFHLDRFGPAFPHHVSMSSRLALHPQLRGSHLLKQLTCTMFRFAKEQGIRFDFIDCHPKLLPLYTRLGYRLYQPGFNHPKYTYVIPMVLVFDDVEHLKRVHSPFVDLAEQSPRSTNDIELLRTQFPGVDKEVLSGMCGDLDRFWDLLQLRLNSSAPIGVACDIFAGLTGEEMKELSSFGHLLMCRQGDVVLTNNDTGREVYLILSGQFQVTGPAKGRPAAPRMALDVKKRLGPGDSFGEIRFLSNHTQYRAVRAVEDATVLVLHSKTLDRLIVSSPKLAAKVYRNFAKIVALRPYEVAA
jgi:predicted GNAT family N-acyltransferase